MGVFGPDRSGRSQGARELGRRRIALGIADILGYRHAASITFRHLKHVTEAGSNIGSGRDLSCSSCTDSLLVTAKVLLRSLNIAVVPLQGEAVAVAGGQTNV